MALKLAVVLIIVAALIGAAVTAVGFWQAWYPLGFIVGGVELVGGAFIAQDQLGGYLTSRRKK